VQEAAGVLGTTVDALRKRVQRGTIQSERDDEGRVWIILDKEQDTARQEPDTGQPPPDSTTLISRLEDEVRFLREELARKDAIMLRLAESIPQIEAPASPEPRESPEPRSGSSTPTEGTGDQEAATERLSWWRRVFGG